MRRREFIASIGIAAVAWPLTAQSQSARIYRIGVLANANDPPWEAFRQGLRDLGYVDGGNITVDWRWSQGNPERFPASQANL